MIFEFDGERYARASKHQKEWGNRVISEFRFRGDERILDLGCGDGALTEQLASMLTEGIVIGIDASKGMIDEAQKRKKRNLSFKLMDINHLNFSEKFDLVFSNATLHWIKDHKRLLTRICDILNEEGTIRFNFAGEGNCRNFNRIVVDSMKQKEFASYFARFEWPWYMPSRDEYAALLEQFPFRKIDVWEENADRYFSNPDEMTGWIDQPSIVPFLVSLDEPYRREFRKRVVERMIDETLQEDGTCFETFRRINVFAKT